MADKVITDSDSNFMSFTAATQHAQDQGDYAKQKGDAVAGQVTAGLAPIAPAVAAIPAQVAAGLAPIPIAVAAAQAAAAALAANTGRTAVQSQADIGSTVGLYVIIGPVETGWVYQRYADGTLGRMKQLEAASATDLADTDLVASAARRAIQELLQLDQLRALPLSVGPQYVAGDRWLPVSAAEGQGRNLKDDGARFLAASGGGFWEREAVGYIHAERFGIRPEYSDTVNGEAILAMFTALSSGLNNNTRYKVLFAPGFHYVHPRQLQSDGSYKDVGIVQPQLITCVGAGAASTVLSCTVELGQGGIFWDLVGGQIDTSAKVFGMALRSYADRAAMGGLPCAMSILRMRAQTIIGDVLVQTGQFGVLLDGDHQQIQAGCKFTNNGWGCAFADHDETMIGADGKLVVASFGDQTFTHTDFTGNTKGSIMVGLKNIMDSVVFHGGHFCFGGFGIKRGPGTPEHGMMNRVLFLKCSFEASGNGFIRDDSDGSMPSMQSVKAQGSLGMAWGGDDVRDPNESADYGFDVWSMSDVDLDFMNAPPPGAPNGHVGAIRCKHQQINATVTLRYANFDELSDRAFQGIVDARIIVGDAEGYLRKVQVNDGFQGYLVAGECVEMAGTDSVKRYGEVAGSYAPVFGGVVQHGCGAGTLVAVFYRGHVQAQLKNCPAQAAQIQPAPDAPGRLTGVPAIGSAPYRTPIVGCSISEQPDGGAVNRQVLLSGAKHQDSRLVLPGMVAGLPPAGAACRGQVLRVEGASGAADTAYMCVKLADDSYSWKSMVLA